MEKLISLDQKWSLAVNSWNSSWADSLMIFFSDRLVWIPLYVLMALWLVGLYKKKSIVILLGVVLLILCADLSSVHLFKNVFCRLRPCHEPLLEGLLHLPAACGGKYGFISSHACNHFALAAYLTPWFYNMWKVDKSIIMHPLAAKGLGFFRYGGLYIWAAIISYSRVYLAAHYIGDVVCGALWGTLVGLLCYLLVKFVMGKLEKKR